MSDVSRQGSRTRGGLPADGTLVLRTKDLSVSFGGVAALANVTFDVAPGEVVAVIGPNGAGKSTLLNAILGMGGAGMVTGSVELFGAPAPAGHASRVRLGIGRSFQDPKLLEDETIMENVLMGAEASLRYSPLRQLLSPRKVTAAESELGDRALELLDTMGLRSSARKRVAGLPYGERKLVDLARALVSGPRLIMLDEPTSGVHGAEQDRVGAVLSEVTESMGIAVVLVEHHMHVVRAHADRVIGLQAGKVLTVGAPDEVLDSDIFRGAILGGESAGAVGGGRPPGA